MLGRALIWLMTCDGGLEREKVMGECNLDQNRDENGGGNHLRPRRGFPKLQGVLAMAIGARSHGIGGGVCACSRVERMREEWGLATSFIGEQGRRMDEG
jgi:hypothetical protein